MIAEQQVSLPMRLSSKALNILTVGLNHNTFCLHTTEYRYELLLLSPQERWRSIVISTSVCLCVCLSASISPEPHARSLPIFVRVAYRRDLVLLQRSDAIPKEGTILGAFFTTDKALYSIAFGTHTKTVRPTEMPFGIMTPVGLRYHV